MQGFVKAILKNGKAGFISGDDGKDYYFRISEFRGNSKVIRKGLKVAFSIEGSFDKKKNIETKAATNVREECLKKPA